MMRRTLRQILSASISLAVLLGLVLIGLDAALEHGVMTPQIEAALQQAVGRPVSLGQISLRPSLAPSVSVRDTVIANLPGGSRPEFARISRIDFEVALAPLIKGRIEIGALVIAGADILLERDSQGRPNWQLRAPFRSAAASGAATGRPGRNLSIGDVRIEDSRLRFAEASFADIEVPRLALGSLTPIGSRALSGMIKVAGETIDLTADIGPVATSPMPLRATLSLAGAKVTVQGSVPPSGSMSDQGWSLALAGTAEDSKRLLALLPGAPPIPIIGPSAFAVRLGPGAPFPTISDVQLHVGAVELGLWFPGLRLDNVEISAPAMDAPVALSLTARRGDTQVAVSATTGSPALLLANNQPLPIEARLVGAGATLTLKGTMTQPFGSSGTRIEAALTAASLDALSPLLASDLPNLRDVKAGGRIEQTGPASFSLQGVSLSATDVDAGVDVQIEAAPRLSLRGQISARRLDLDALVDAFTGPADAARPARSGRVIPDLPLPLSTLRSFDATLAFSADTMMAGEVPWRGVKGNLALQGGRLTLAPVAGSTAGGSLHGRLSVDAASTPPTASLFLQNDGRGFDFAALRRAVGSTSGFAGPAEVVLDLKGQATTTRTFAATLSGNLGVALVNGRMLGVAPISIGPDLSRLLLPKGAPANGVAIDCVAIRLSANDGIVQSQALLVDGPDGRIEGNLAVDLRDELLVMRLLPDMRVLGVTVRTPVAIEGPLGAPRVDVDPGRAFGRLMVDTVANRLWQSSAVEWIRRRTGGAPGAHTCAAQLRLARLGQNGPVPKPRALLPGLPQELQGAMRNTLRGIGTVFRKDQ